MGIKKTSVTWIEGRWEISGSTPTVGELIGMAEILKDNSVDITQPIYLEPSGINGAGTVDKACFLLKPYKAE